MKMREYVDSLQGEGSWDRMHDSISKMDLFGWDMPPVEVDGRTVHIFPGTDREVTLEAVQNEIRKSIGRAKEMKDIDGDLDYPPDSGLKEQVRGIDECLSVFDVIKEHFSK